MRWLTDKIEFPDIASATSEGLLAIGGDLSSERLILAYKKGIFPWFDTDEPILWWSPDPRFVLVPDRLKVSKSMAQLLRNSNFIVTVNKAFNQVIDQCQKINRSGQSGTWITKEMKTAYKDLHELGYAKSVEVWLDEQLVGGFYGIDLNNGVFSGESMFSKVSNASKIAFITFIQNTNYELIDCQVYTTHLANLGAEEMSRLEFLDFLN